MVGASSKHNVSSEMLGHVRRGINDSFGSPTAFRRTYLQEPDGCVPQEFIGDDLLYAIKEKFYWPFDAVRCQLEKEFGNERMMWVHVDPTYEDTTHALLTLEDQHVLLADYCKAWKFWWPTEAAMKKELLEWHTLARDRYRQVRKEYVQKAGNHLYFVDFELTSGEYGQPFCHVFEARNTKDLERQIARYLKDYYGDDSDSRREKNVWSYFGGEVSVKLHGWQEIKDAAEVLNALRV